MSGHSHPHGAHTALTTRVGASGVVMVVLAANTVLAVVQVVFSWLLGSISLLADSVHQVTDVVGLGIALVAIRLAARGVTRRNTWGWGRADVMGALFSALLLVGSSLWIVIEAWGRLMDPQDIDGAGVLVIAIVGLMVNGVSAIALARISGTLATRAAVVHLIGDAAGSAGVLLAAVAVLVADATWVDPAVAIVIAIWVGWSGWTLLRSSTRVLMDVVPSDISPDDVSATIEGVDGVDSVHHLHLWEMVPAELSVSAHIEVSGDMAVHESQLLLEQVRQALLDRHGIDHSTFEVECHPCEDVDHGVRSRPDGATDLI